MENVDLCSGTFRYIFDHWLATTTQPYTVYFDDLFEQGFLVVFDAPGELKFPLNDDVHGCFTLEPQAPMLKSQSLT